MCRSLFPGPSLTLNGRLPPPPSSAPPPSFNPAVQALPDSVRTDRVEADERGVGAPRCWLNAEFERTSVACGSCLEVMDQKTVVSAGETDRIPSVTPVYNVVAIQRGTEHPNRYVLMGEHLNSRESTARSPLFKLMVVRKSLLHYVTAVPPLS